MSIKNRISNTPPLDEVIDLYREKIIQLVTKVPASEIEILVTRIEKAVDMNKTIYIFGNGGSAATASHMANDIHKSVFDYKKGKIFCLNDSTSKITCIGNDYGFEHIFAHQITASAEMNDLVIAISASGNSHNVINGLKAAKAKGCVTFSILGFDGGQAALLSDSICLIKTEIGEYGPVEDVHLILNYILVHVLSLRISS